MQKVKFSYVIANAMNLVNPYLPWQEKKKKKKEKILFVKLRSEQCSINKEKKHLLELHKQKKMIRL